MARGDIQLRTPIDDAFTVSFGTASTVKAGEPTKGVDAAGASPWLGTTAIMVDGDGTTSQRFTGIAKTDNANSAVSTYLPLPGVIYRAKAKDATGIDTQAKIITFMGKRVVFDLTASAWTVDAAAADAVANCVTIVGGDFRVPELHFVYAPKGTFLAFCVSA